MRSTDRQVGVAVLVEVGEDRVERAADVGDAADVDRSRGGGERSRAIVDGHERHRAPDHVAVGRRHVADVGDHGVIVAVAVDVTGGQLGGRPVLGDHRRERDRRRRAERSGTVVQVRAEAVDSSVPAERGDHVHVAIAVDVGRHDRGQLAGRGGGLDHLGRTERPRPVVAADAGHDGLGPAEASDGAQQVEVGVAVDVGERGRRRPGVIRTREVDRQGARPVVAQNGQPAGAHPDHVDVAVVVDVTRRHARRAERPPEVLGVLQLDGDRPCAQVAPSEQQRRSHPDARGRPARRSPTNAHADLPLRHRLVPRGGRQRRTLEPPQHGPDP